MNDTIQNPMEHPDELLLVAWSEERLLDFERPEIEAHLAECAECRALVAELAAELAEASDVAPTPAALPSMDRGGGGGGWMRGWTVALAAAALLLVATLIPRWWQPVATPATPGTLQLAISSTSDVTFGVQRGAPVATDDFYVGLRLDEGGWVRLVALIRDGSVLEIPLDKAGATTTHFEGGMDHTFGPYPVLLGEGQLVAEILALVSSEELAWEAVQQVGWKQQLDPAQLQALAAILDARCIAQTVGADG